MYIYTLSICIMYCMYVQAHVQYICYYNHIFVTSCDIYEHGTFNKLIIQLKL